MKTITFTETLVADCNADDEIAIIIGENTFRLGGVSEDAYRTTAGRGLKLPERMKVWKVTREELPAVSADKLSGGILHCPVCRQPHYGKAVDLTMGVCRTCLNDITPECVTKEFQLHIKEFLDALENLREQQARLNDIQKVCTK